MSSTDDRIVSMQFDNRDFETRLRSTLAGLDKLDQTIQMAGAKQGLTEVSNAASKMNLGSIASSLDNISSKFSALGAIGFSVIQKLTQGVMGFVANLANTAKTDVLDPIITGGKSRAGALQQAKFQFEGLGMDVNASMASALAAVKGTAYGLDEAATVAAQFGASGIKAGDQMTQALTGISGIAAMTGRSYSEIGQIFTSMAGQGKVSSMDLMEFGIRGVNAAAAYGKETGQTEAQVRSLVSAGKVGFPEFAAAMDKAFGQHAKDANQTYAGSLSNLHAAMSRLGASFFSDRLNQERDLFNALTPVVDNFTTAIKPLTDEIIKLAGAGNDRLIKFLDKVDFSKFSRAISNAVGALANASNMVHTYLGIIGTAFKDVFPKSGGLVNALDSITYFFEHMFKVLTPGGSAVLKIQEIFVGLFSTLNIVRDVLKGVGEVLLSFFGSFLGPGAAGASTILQKIARAMDSFDQAFVTTGKIDNFFNHLADLAKLPAQYLEKLEDDIAKLFTTSGRSSGAVSALDRVKKSIDGLNVSAQGIHGVLQNIGTWLGEAWTVISHWFSEIGNAIANAFSASNFHSALSLINTALLGGIVIMLKDFFDKGFKSFDIGGGLFAQVKSSLEGLTGVLKGMQTEIKANVLKEIAIAVGVLAASIVVLSMIKPAALQQAMSALAFGFAQLVVVMKILNSMTSGVGGGAKLALLGTAMMEMASSVVILAGAVRLLSGLGMEPLAKGLGGIALALGILVGAAKLMEGGSVGMVAAAIAMNGMATALAILAGVVHLFAAMSWGEMAKGLTGVAVSLLIIAGVMQLMPVGSTLAAGLAMIPLATGITILAGAVRIFAGMSIGEIAKGLIAMAGALAIIAVAMNAMPLTMAITGAGLVIVAMALNLMVPAIKMIGNMGIEQMAKGLGGLAAMLLILAVGVNAMSGAIGGAAALLVAAGALLILSGVLHAIADLSWAQLLEGLVGLAAVLAVLGIGAALLEPLIPALLGLGVALDLIGLGFALFGAGAFLIVTAFTMLAAGIGAGAAAIIVSLLSVIKAIPQFVEALVSAVTASAVALLNGLKTLLPVVATILTDLLALVVRLAPQIAAAIAAIVTAALGLIRKMFPQVIQTAFDLLMDFLKAIEDNLPKVIEEAVHVMVTFINTLIGHIPQMVESAVKLLTSFLAAIANKAGDITTAGVNTLVAFLNGIANNLSKVVDAVAHIYASFITAIGNGIGQVVTAGVNILINFVAGLVRDITNVATAATNIAIAFVNAMANNAIRFINAAAQALLNFLNGLNQAIKTYEPQLIAAGFSIMGSIITGLINGITQGWSQVSSYLINKAKSLLGDVLNLFGIGSPSRVFHEIGQNLMLGLANGINADTFAASSVVTQAEQIVQAFSASLTQIPDSLAGMSEFQPVIRPVLDLTGVKAAAGGISSMIPAPSISPEMSLAQASTIASTAQVAGVPQTPAPEHKELTFNQTIYSPDALSTNDIYKHTKSQLAQAKEELQI